MVLLVIINGVMLRCYFSKSKGNKYSFAAVLRCCAIVNQNFFSVFFGNGNSCWYSSKGLLQKKIRKKDDKKVDEHRSFFGLSFSVCFRPSDNSLVHFVTLLPYTSRFSYFTLLLPFLSISYRLDLI